MRSLFAFVVLAFGLAAGCSGDLEKYILTNKGVLFVYGKNFAYSTFKPEGWVSDRLIPMTNDLSLYIRPANRTDINIISYGIVLSDKGPDPKEVTEIDAKKVLSEALGKNPGLKMETVTNTITVDKAARVYRYSYTGKKAGKGYFMASAYIVWEKSVVVAAVQLEDPAQVDNGKATLDRFLTGIKYWGYDADKLSMRVVNALFKRK
jgi:hypothetical protein